MFLPVDVATADTIVFLESRFCLAGLRVLEVGCGKGEVAVALQDKGVTVQAIDIDVDAVETARAAGANVKVADILTYNGDEPFDVVLFSRSLHHVNPLVGAIQSAKRNLKKSGVLIAEDFAPEVADHLSFSWLRHVEDLLVTAGALQRNHGHGHEQKPHARLQDPLAEWQHHHFVAHDLARSDQIIAAISAEFQSVEIETCAYLYRYVVRYLRKDDVGARLAEQVLDWERELIELEGILPIGRRFIAQ